MSVQDLNPKELADLWSQRVADRMRDLNLPEEEVNENYLVIHSFVFKAADLIKNEPVIKVPYSDDVIPIDGERAQLIIDLFLRGVNHVSKRLRDSGKPWDERKTLLEDLAWKVYNLAKLLVALQIKPNKHLGEMFKSHGDLKTMMKASAEEVLTNEVPGIQPQRIGRR